MNQKKSMIEFKSVFKAYSNELFRKAKPALNDVTFRLESGKTLGLIGPNGAGKSTSIRLVMDFIRPDRGTVRIFDSPIRNVKHREKIGYLPEIACFPPHLNIIDLLNFTGKTCQLNRAEIKDRSQYLLQLLDLMNVKRKKLKTFSKGMQQRASFCLALLNDPDLLILDEPMSGLDPIGRKQISNLISRLKENNKTILLCTHILEDIDKLADEILLLHHGKTIFYGSPQNLCNTENDDNLQSAFLATLSRDEHVTFN